MPTVIDRRSGIETPRRVPARRARGGPATCATTAPATLEDAIVGAWQSLRAHGTVTCLVCGGGMTPRYGAASHEPVGGRCVDCGAVIG